MSKEKSSAKKKIPKLKKISPKTKKSLIIGAIVAAVAIAGIVGGIAIIEQFDDKGGTLIIGIVEVTTIDNLEPIDSFWHEEMILEQVAETLFEVNYYSEQPQIIPNLATEHEWNADATELTCYLRKNVKFHDGTPFNAEAVKYNFDRIHNISGGNSYLLYLADGGLILNRTEVINNYTVKFVLNTPFIPFLALLTHRSTSILSPTATPSDELMSLVTHECIGTGPFIFEEYTPDVNLTLSANPEYWGGKPKIDEIIFLSYSNRSILWDAMLAKEITMLDPWFFSNIPERNFSNTAIDVFRSNPEFTVQERPGYFLRYIGMKNDLINLTMRKSISYAFNYSYVIEEIWQNRAVRARSYLHDFIFYSNQTAFDVPSYNLTKARQILIDELGAVNSLVASLTANENITAGNEWERLVTKGTPIASYNMTCVIWHPLHNLTANLLQNNLKQIGVDVTVGFYGMPAPKEIYKQGWFLDYNDPCNVINIHFSNTSLMNYVQMNDPSLQKWMDEALGEVNKIAREQLYYKIQERIIEELYPWILLLQEKDIDIHLSNLRGFQQNPLKTLFKTVYFV